jgi:hypothetical protein
MILKTFSKENLISLVSDGISSFLNGLLLNDRLMKAHAKIIRM